MKSTLATISAVGLILASTAALAESAAEHTPGHQMQEKGSVEGSPGASGYAPGQQKEPGESASEYAPGQVKKSQEDTDTDMSAGTDTSTEADTTAEADAGAETSTGAGGEAGVDAEAGADVSAHTSGESGE